MPSIGDFFIEFSFGTANIGRAQAEAEAELEELKRRLKAQGGEIEQSAKAVGYGLGTVTTGLLKLFGVYLTFEGFKSLITGVAETTTRLYNLSQLTEETPDALNRWAFAAQAVGGSREAVFSFFESFKDQLNEFALAHPGEGYELPPRLRVLSYLFGGQNILDKKPVEILRRLKQKVDEEVARTGQSITITRLRMGGFEPFAYLLTRPEAEFNEIMANIAKISERNVRTGTELQKSLTELSSQWQTLQFNILTALEPMLKPTVEALTEMLAVVNSILAVILALESKVGEHGERNIPGAPTVTGPSAPGAAPYSRMTPDEGLGSLLGTPEPPRDPETPKTPKQSESAPPANVPGTAPSTPGGFNAPESIPQEAPAPTPETPKTEPPKTETAKPETAPPISPGRTYDIPDIPFGATGGQEVVRRMKEAGIKLPPDVEATIASGNKPTKEQLDRISDADLDKVGSVLGKPIYHKAAPRPETKPAAKPSAEPKQDDTGGYFGGGKYKFPDLPKGGAQSMRDLEGMQVLPAAERTEVKGDFSGLSDKDMERILKSSEAFNKKRAAIDFENREREASRRAFHNEMLFFGSRIPGRGRSRVPATGERALKKFSDWGVPEGGERHGMGEGDKFMSPEERRAHGFGAPIAPWASTEMNAQSPAETEFAERYGRGPEAFDEALRLRRPDLFGRDYHHETPINYVPPTPSPEERAASGPVTIEHHDDTETHISSLTVNTPATDAHDIAKDIHRALAENKRPSLREEREALHARPETSESPELRRLRGESAPAPTRSPTSSGDRGSTDRLMQRMNEYNAETPPPANNAARRNLGLQEIERGQDALTGSPFSAAGVRGLEGTPSGAAAPGAPPARQPPQVTAAGQGANLSGGYLRSGARGAQVRNLQSELGVTPTGRFDHRTQIAVRQFQRRTGLNPDGIVGPKTLAAMRSRREPRPDVRPVDQ